MPCCSICNLEDHKRDYCYELYEFIFEIEDAKTELQPVLEKRIHIKTKKQLDNLMQGYIRKCYFRYSDISPHIIYHSPNIHQAEQIPRFSPYNGIIIPYNTNVNNYVIIGGKRLNLYNYDKLWAFICECTYQFIYASEQNGRQNQNIMVAPEPVVPIQNNNYISITKNIINQYQTIHKSYYISYMHTTDAYTTDCPICLSTTDIMNKKHYVNIMCNNINPHIYCDVCVKKIFHREGQSCAICRQKVSELRIVSFI